MKLSKLSRSSEGGVVVHNGRSLPVDGNLTIKNA